MTNDTFNPGDVVKLNSGGPAMTISYIGTGTDRRCTCLWFHGPELMVGSFHPEALTKTEPRKPTAMMVL